MVKKTQTAICILFSIVFVLVSCKSEQDYKENAQKLVSDMAHNNRMAFEKDIKKSIDNYLYDFNLAHTYLENYRVDITRLEYRAVKDHPHMHFTTVATILRNKNDATAMPVVLKIHYRAASPYSTSKDFFSIEVTDTNDVLVSAPVSPIHIAPDSPGRQIPKVPVFGK